MTRTCREIDIPLSPLLSPSAKRGEILQDYTRPSTPSSFSTTAEKGRRSWDYLSAFWRISLWQRGA